MSTYSLQRVHYVAAVLICSWCLLVLTWIFFLLFLRKIVFWNIFPIGVMNSITFRPSLTKGGKGWLVYLFRLCRVICPFKYFRQEGRCFMMWQVVAFIFHIPYTDNQAKQNVYRQKKISRLTSHSFGKEIQKLIFSPQFYTSFSILPEYPIKCIREKKRSHQHWNADTVGFLQAPLLARRTYCSYLSRELNFENISSLEWYLTVLFTISL